VLLVDDGVTVEASTKARLPLLNMSSRTFIAEMKLSFRR
jgi:hypothetical protein